MLYSQLLASPVGDLTLIATEHALCAVLWQGDRPGRVPLGESRHVDAHPVLHAATRQLEEYFAGIRRDFDLPLAFTGTPFQQQVWAALLRIPYGETRSYLQVAQALGNPSAVRAVGAANGRNPISIIAPCHRVVGSNGTLTGFAGGLAAKQWLLAHECPQGALFQRLEA